MGRTFVRDLHAIEEHRRSLHTTMTDERRLRQMERQTTLAQIAKSSAILSVPKAL